MLNKQWRLTCLGIGALVVSMSQARADDTIRMGGKGSIQDAGANLTRLDIRPQEADEDDTVPVWYKYRYGFGRGFYGGGFKGGFYRGFYPSYGFGFNNFGFNKFYGNGFGFNNFGFNRFYGGGFGFNNFYRGGFGYNNFYRGGFGFNNFGFNRFYGGGFGFNKFYGGYRNFGYSPFYGGFRFISGTVDCDQGSPITLQFQQVPPLRPADSVAPMNPNLDEQALPNPQEAQPQNLQPLNPNGGFRYDGGPVNPVPLPQGSPEPKAEPNPQLGVPDRSVSLPLKPTVAAPKKFQYAAYGEKPKTETVPAKTDDTLFVKSLKK